MQNAESSFTEFLFARPVWARRLKQRSAAVRQQLIGKIYAASRVSSSAGSVAGNPATRTVFMNSRPAGHRTLSAFTVVTLVSNSEYRSGSFVLRVKFRIGNPFTELRKILRQDAASRFKVPPSLAVRIADRWRQRWRLSYERDVHDRSHNDRPVTRASRPLNRRNGSPHYRCRTCTLSKRRSRLQKGRRRVGCCEPRTAANGTAIEAQ